MHSFQQDLSLLEAVAIAGKVTGPSRQLRDFLGTVYFNEIEVTAQSTQFFFSSL